MIWFWLFVMVIPISNLLIGAELSAHYCIWIAVGAIGTSFEIYRLVKRERMKSQYRKRNGYTNLPNNLGGGTPYMSGGLRRKADEKREYMYTMLNLLNEEKAKLDRLEQNRASMTQDDFDREFRYQYTVVARREQYYNQAVEEYRAAELEAPL